MVTTDQPLPERETRARLRRSKWYLHPGVRTGDQLTIGERAADRMRNGMGSWTFVGAFLLIMAVWILVNSALKIGHPLSGGTQGFDPYPYILLNLVLSTMAGLQAAALLIAAKRADAISSEIAVHTLKNTESDRRLLEENTELTRVVKSHTDILDDLHARVMALCTHQGVAANPSLPERRPAEGAPGPQAPA